MASFIFFMAEQPLVGQSLLIIEPPRSHSRHTTLGRTPLDEWSARRTDLYLATHNTHKRQTATPPAAGIEPVIPESEWPQTHALECAATGIGILASCFTNIRNGYLRNRSQVRYHAANFLDIEQGLDQSLVSRITMWMISVLKKA